MTSKIWHTKIAARIHDPAEKALVLMRDPEGHENGTSLALSRLMGLKNYVEDDADSTSQTLSAILLKTPFKSSVSPEIYGHIQRADWWAAAADRPQWPMQELDVTTKKGKEITLKVAPGSQVHFTKQPVLIHPLTGDEIGLRNLTTTEVGDIKKRSLDHHLSITNTLGIKGDEPYDKRRALLAFWRFAPELKETADNGELGVLWHHLPADTRVPDHNIWDHLDLTSAFAGAFAADPNGEAALLTMALGPVQSFIAAARSTSDLWAGSHLLSRLAWEAMRPLCEELGPDAVLFPRLRGIPQVDLWLRDQMGLPESMFKGCDWQEKATDANPLFSAALPNRFVAVVPASQAKAIAKKSEQAVRAWLQQTGKEVVERLLNAAEITVNPELYCFEQMQQQLQGFPEVHWAVVPFSLIQPRNVQKQNDLDTTQLSAAMAPFFGVSPNKPCGFLSSPAWKVLQKDMAWDDRTTFWSPNPGTLYPAVYDLAERALAAAKAGRTFAQLPQNGWRCSLTGESEWLTTDREQLKKSYRNQSDTLWAKLHGKKKSWVKDGEHLGAMAALKRLWPSLFADEVAKAMGHEATSRFVVSTHTMALAGQMKQWADGASPEKWQALAQAVHSKDADMVALPRALLKKLSKENAAALKSLPALLEEADDDAEYDAAQRQVRDILGVDKLETYYSMILMDGDRMGAILSGDTKTKTAIKYIESFHPKVRPGFEKHAQKHEDLQNYGQQARAISPNRHLAISGALNDFSQTVVRHVVEVEHLGRLIYAGGDDVLAMLPTSDLLSVMQRLRDAYSGTLPDDEKMDWGKAKYQRNTLHCKNGFGILNGRLMRLMGKHATASCGAVIAHHQAPMGSVLQALREAEKRAKNEGGRNAFSITVVKRSGGALYLTANWGKVGDQAKNGLTNKPQPMLVLQRLIDFLRLSETSRRAVYNSLEWLRDLPEPTDTTSTEMLSCLLAYQLDRQTSGEGKEWAPKLAEDLAQLCQDQHQIRSNKKPLSWLANFMSVAEFFAREVRSERTEEHKNSTLTENAA